MSKGKICAGNSFRRLLQGQLREKESLFKQWQREWRGEDRFRKSCSNVDSTELGDLLNVGG